MKLVVFGIAGERAFKSVAFNVEDICLRFTVPGKADKEAKHGGAEHQRMPARNQS